jgi:hypothetical protein
MSDQLSLVCSWRSAAGWTTPLNSLVRICAAQQTGGPCFEFPEGQPFIAAVSPKHRTNSTSTGVHSSNRQAHPHACAGIKAFRVTRPLVTNIRSASAP